MRPDCATGGLGEITDRLHEFWSRGIGVDVENEDATRIQSGQPELVSVVGEPGVVSFIATIDRRGADNFAVSWRAGLYVDRDNFVRAIAETFDAERPNIDELFLSFDPGKVR